MKGTQAGRSGAHSSLARCGRLEILLLDVCICALPFDRHHTEGVCKGAYDLVELEVMKSLQVRLLDACLKVPWDDYMRPKYSF
jgi:methyl coenzyme M reductase subunit C